MTKDFRGLGKKEGFNSTTMLSIADVTTPGVAIHGKVQRQSYCPDRAMVENVSHAAEVSKRLSIHFGVFSPISLPAC